MTSRRQRKVAELLHEEISQLIQYDTQDPRLGYVTVTGVDVSADLRLAWVYITVLGDDADAQNSLKALENAAGYFRHTLRETLSLRFIPELRFKVDNSLEHGARIESLLDTIKEEHPQAQDMAPSPSDE
jgi:ribosome-binding factor A